MTIATVRMLIPDRQHYDRGLATGDGAALEFQLPNYPVIADSERVYLAGVLKVKPADYSIDNDLGLITFTVAPGVGVAIVATYQHTVLSDAALTAFLTLEANNDKLAAALGLETIASDTAMVLKVIRILDLTTDGAKTSDALLARAKLLRAQAAAEDVDGAFNWAEMVVNDFSYREFLLKNALRD